MSHDTFYLRKVTQRPYLISSLDRNILVKVFYTKWIKIQDKHWWITELATVNILMRSFKNTILLIEMFIVEYRFIYYIMIVIKKK